LCDSLHARQQPGVPGPDDFYCPRTGVAISRTGRPLFLNSSTAPRRNRSRYGGCMRGMDTTSFPSDGTDPSDQVSTRLGILQRRRRSRGAGLVRSSRQERHRGPLLRETQTPLDRCFRGVLARIRGEPPSHVICQRSENGRSAVRFLNRTQGISEPADNVDRLPSANPSGFKRS